MYITKLCKGVLQLKILKENASNVRNVVDIAVNNIIDNFVSSEISNLAIEIASLNKGYDADWCGDGNSQTALEVNAAIENLAQALKKDLLANYKGE